MTSHQIDGVTKGLRDLSLYVMHIRCFYFISHRPLAISLSKKNHSEMVIVLFIFIHNAWNGHHELIVLCSVIRFWFAWMHYLSNNLETNIDLMLFQYLGTYSSCSDVQIQHVRINKCFEIRRHLHGIATTPIHWKMWQLMLRHWCCCWWCCCVFILIKSLIFEHCNFIILSSVVPTTAQSQIMK